jgi:hypothetical protein
MNIAFYNPTAWRDRTTAEILLAKTWRQAAIAEKHVKRFPGHAPIQMPAGACRKAGVLDAIRAYAAQSTKPFTRTDLEKAMPQFSKSQLTSALSNAAEKEIAVVGKTSSNLNIYARVQG